MKSLRSFILPAALLLIACAWVAMHRMPTQTGPSDPNALLIVELPGINSDSAKNNGPVSTTLPPASNIKAPNSEARITTGSTWMKPQVHGKSIRNPFVSNEPQSLDAGAMRASSTAPATPRDSEKFEFLPLQGISRIGVSPGTARAAPKPTPESQAVAWETVVVPNESDDAVDQPALSVATPPAVASATQLDSAPIPSETAAAQPAITPQANPQLSDRPPTTENTNLPTSSGAHRRDQASFDLVKPTRSLQGCEVPPVLDDFSSQNPGCEVFDPQAEIQIYQGKTLNATQRPLLELGRPWYQLGQFAPSQTFWGSHNPLTQQFIVFGDSRLAVASNRQPGNSQTLFALQSNLFFDWKLTGTERVHFNITPATQGANNSRWLMDEDRFVSEFNADINFGFFEGDLGALAGGFTNRTLPFDLPVAIGVIPLVMQNGIWLEDAFLGVAATIPARNSAILDISNYDITFFAGWDKLNSPAFGSDDNAAKVYGIASWIEAWNGYVEADYAYLEDRDQILNRSYHNIGLAYTRRLGHFLSNSTRIIVNAGQSAGGGSNSADGVLFLSENSLITANPSNVLPYINLFAGFDRPQSVGRAGAAGGILRNTGILFESDNLTGYPTLDSSANQTYGLAAGLSLMPQNFNQQLILEAAYLGVMGDDLGRLAAGDQRGLGFRYQLPLNNSIIFRVDGMYGFLADSEDINGLRMELRKKF